MQNKETNHFMIDLEKSAIKTTDMEQELRNSLEKLLEKYEERLPQITNDRFWTDREEAYAYGRESELEDVISDLKTILYKVK
jgi:hypothetical protein